MSKELLDELAYVAEKLALIHDWTLGEDPPADKVRANYTNEQVIERLNNRQSAIISPGGVRRALSVIQRARDALIVMAKQMAAGVVATPIFETERLRVFMFRIEPTDTSSEKDVFMAFHRGDGYTDMVANVTIDPAFPPIRELPLVDWIEVSSDKRRQGFGTELLDGIEQHYGQELEMTPGTEAGERFIDYLEARAMEREAVKP